MIVGSGIDVIEIARIEQALARRPQRFAERICTEAERDTCLRFARPAVHFAVRFAAKEAAMKAVGTGWAKGVGWRDAETVVHGASPDLLGLLLHGRRAEIARERGATRWHLSVSRTRSHALAVVVLEAGRA
jgi:holo-[acyl-carrier protein] synthase